ncbi:MAG: hypothetical protein IIY32_08255, partial [Thermoguttaceae bacterium]|nr:hypothetical protein [Thermoguttaceae bacterium]
FLSRVLPFIRILRVCAVSGIFCYGNTPKFFEERDYRNLRSLRLVLPSTLGGRRFAVKAPFFTGRIL